MKFRKTLLALSLLITTVAAHGVGVAQAQANNDYAPSAAPQLETPGSLPPPGLESTSATSASGLGGNAGGGQGKGHRRKGRKGQQGQANPQKRKQMMARLDTNGDGMIDDTERAAAKAMRGQHRGGKGGGAGAGRGASGGKRGGKTSNPADKAARRQKMMARFDTNGDGQLDSNEKAAVQAFREQRRQQRMQRQGGAGQ
ncbi:MAG: hypothetical protein Q8T09_21880 [Candidatus Melainabacteria bacterium]|nr:hypothetical protein [Candidatus Melainabacteria bacterium]